MSDYTEVRIHLQKAHLETAIQVIKGLHYNCDGQYDVFIPDQSNLCTIYLGSINYGKIDDIEDALTEMGIAHEYEWDSGSTFESGATHIRFNKDGSLNYRTYNGNGSENSPENLMLADILKVAETGDIQAIINKIQAEIDLRKIPDWDDQIELGQLFVKVSQSSKTQQQTEIGK